MNSRLECFKHVESTIKQRAEHLDLMSWANVFTWDELLVLCRYLSLFEVEKGEIVFQQSDNEHFMCIVLSGVINVSKENDEKAAKTNKVFAKIGKDRTLGEMSLIDRQPRSATAIAEKDVLMLVLTQDHFKVLEDEYPRIWGKLLLKICRQLSQRLRSTTGILVDYLATN